MAKKKYKDKYMIHKHNGHLLHPDILKEKANFCIKKAEDMAFKFCDLLKDNVNSCSLN